MKEANNAHRYFIAIFISFLLMYFIIINVYAGANYLSNNIQTNYSTGDIIRGNFQISLANHPGDALFTSNFLGNITLLDLILNQSGLNSNSYSCTTIGCTNDFSSSELTNNVNIESGAASYAGFGVDGTGITITNALVRIDSNAPSSCSPNLYVDLLGDNLDVLTSSKSSGISCGIKHTGCYNQSNNVETEIITGKEYCETISIPAAPGIIVGAKVRIGSGESNLTMKLYDSETNELLGSCKLPQNTQTLDELKCTIDHSSHSTKSYHVCLSTSTNNNYKVGWETSSPTCGTAQGFNSFNSDFDLFAETMKYAASPSLVLNESDYMSNFGVSLTQTVDSYLQNRYNGECQTNTCFIPIKIFGGNQLVNLNSNQLEYESFGVPANNQAIYKLRYNAPRVSATNLTLDISKANFVIPISSNENSFKLYLDGNQLFQRNISLRRGFAFDITPKFVSFGQNTRFFLTSSSNISSSTWDFGDGSPVVTINGTSLNHLYTLRNSSSINLTVTAISNQTQATKQFLILIGDPKIVANQTINEYRTRLTNISSQINSYPSWIRQKIQESIKISNMTNQLDLIERNYVNSTTEQQYQEIMLELIELNVPQYVTSTMSGTNIPLSAGYENININYLEQIENNQVADDSALKEQAIGWMNSKFDPTISFETISRINEFGSDPIATLFTIRTNPTDYNGETAYLIFGQDIEAAGQYKTDYNINSISGSGVDYVNIENGNQIFEFIIDGEFSAESLGSYIAPSLSVIGSSEIPTGECNLNNICDSNEDANSCPEDCSHKWFKFTLIGWIIILVIGLIAYIFLQEWYKRNYQKSLFPNDNDLYNVVNFVYNARKSGLKDSEIKAKLRQQKWSNEQVTFAFKKIDGKRTGMFEIPIFTWREHRNTIKQISKRQPGPIDARFIKRRSY